jgi:hypothetical protein
MQIGKVFVAAAKNFATLLLRRGLTVKIFGALLQRCRACQAQISNPITLTFSVDRIHGGETSCP